MPSLTEHIVARKSHSWRCRHQHPVKHYQRSKPCPLLAYVCVPTRHQNTSTGVGLFEVNGVAFESPSIPVLLQILSGAQKASDLLPNGSIYSLDANKSVELTIPGGAAGGPVSHTES